MKTNAETSYKTKEKKDFTPEEFAKAKTTCDFVIELTKAISRSGYYDAHHPVSLDVKKGLYDAFINALGDSSEIMLTCHDVEDQVDIHISGILEEPFNIRKLTKENTSDLFVPKLKDYFERKSLNSFVIKKYITPEHFESFIDVMSEPIADSTDASNLGEYLTKALVDLDINEVSTIFKNDIMLSLKGKLPWRVSIILRRLAKDLKVVPMFRNASAEKMKMIKKQIVEDIIRPLNNNDLLKDLIVNCDVIVDHITHLMEVDELETLIISSLPANAVIPISHAVLEVYKENKEGKSHEDDSISERRNVYLAKVLNIAARRIFSEKMLDVKGLFEQLYEYGIINYEMLPEKMRFDKQSSKLASEVIYKIDTYMENLSKVSSIKEMEDLFLTFKRLLPEFVRMKEWRVINRIINAFSDLSSRKEDILKESELLLNLPDSILEGAEEIIADEYIQANKDLKNEINDVLLKSKSICVKIVDVMIDKSKEPDVLKGVIEILSKKGEVARRWSTKILDEQKQPLSIINVALLVIINVGHGDDMNSIKSYVKHSNPSIRVKALAAIAKMNKKEAVGMVIEALTDEEERVRSQAANLIENELSLSGESINKLLLFVKEKLHKKNITANEAGFIAGLLRSTGKFNNGHNKESLENEIIGIASDLLNERKGFLKFIKTELSKEQKEIICACASALGKTGGAKSKEFLKTLSKNDAVLSNAAKEAMAQLDKNCINK